MGVFITKRLLNLLTELMIQPSEKLAMAMLQVVQAHEAV